MHCFDDAIADAFVKRVPHAPFSQPEQGTLKVFSLVAKRCEVAPEKWKSFQFERIFDVYTKRFGMSKEQASLVALYCFGTTVRGPSKPLMNFCRA